MAICHIMFIGQFDYSDGEKPTSILNISESIKRVTIIIYRYIQLHESESSKTIDILKQEVEERRCGNSWQFLVVSLPLQLQDVSATNKVSSCTHKLLAS